MRSLPSTLHSKPAISRLVQGIHLTRRALRSTQNEAQSVGPRRASDKIRWGKIWGIVGFALLCPLVGSARWGEPVCHIALGLLLWLCAGRETLEPRLNFVFGTLL